jgi:Leucine-rich repeat (LRR) protein
MPGEKYQLLWEVSNGKKSSSDTVTVTFAPLETEITVVSDSSYQTRIMLNGKTYDKGLWTINGDIHHLRGLSNQGLDDEKDPNVLIYGFENKTVEITWTTWYGSKSASATVEFSSGEYQQLEALQELGILDNKYYYKENENGDVVEITMLGIGRAWIFSDLEQFPELQALKHLEKLVLPGNPIYEFPEVITKSYHKLKYLDLSHNYFTSIPEDFGNLTELDTLIISSIPYISTLPESIGNLKKLKYLDMVHAGLTSLPESFSEMTSLNYVSLELNNIKKLPENIGNLKNLETFRGPVLSESIPASFSDLSSLKFCFFTVTGYNNAVFPEDFGRLTNLETLWLSGDYRRLPESFVNLTQLKDLSIGSGTGLTEIPAEFGNLNKLRRLLLVVRMPRLPESFDQLVNLESLGLHGELHYLPNDIGNLKNLTGLSASNLKLKELPESFAELKNLRDVRLFSNEIIDLPSSLGELDNLYIMDIGRNKISEFPPSMAKLADTLRYLAVNGNNFSESQLAMLREMLPDTDITFTLPGD